MYTVRNSFVIVTTAIIVHLLIIWQGPYWIMDAFEIQLINNVKYGDNAGCGKNFTDGVYYINPECLLKKDRGTMPNLDVLYTICFYEVNDTTDYSMTTTVPVTDNFWVLHVYEQDTDISYFVNNNDLSGNINIVIEKDGSKDDHKDAIHVKSNTNTGMILIRAFFATTEEEKLLEKQRRNTTCQKIEKHG